MTLVGLARRCAIGIVLSLMLSGCFQDEDSQLDEKKEPNFISGMNLISAMDYQGAIDAFEKALEVNPRSASAHFELGWLYEEKAAEPDPAAAIYHYDRYLKYSSKPDNADVVRQIINRCKLELARSVTTSGPLAPPAQRELDRVLGENKELQARMAAMQAQLDQAKGGVVARSVTQVVVPAPANRVPASNGGSAPHTEGGHVTAPAAKLRTHTVKAGETLAAIARNYGVSLSALTAANPQVKPTRLMVGQTLNIPGS